ncbi:MAG: hypothetical protein ABIJ61_04955 [bacterium]
MMLTSKNRNRHFSRDDAGWHTPTQQTGGKLFLFFLLLLIAYVLWIYQLKPWFATQAPEHEPLRIDEPPVELTSLQCRAGGKLLTPTFLAAQGDSLYVGFSESSQIDIYSGSLKFVDHLSLTNLPDLKPCALAATDSFLIVGDATAGGFAVCDLDGYRRATISWYPDSSRVKPLQLTAGFGMLTLTDAASGRIAQISLIDHPPFYKFLELVRTFPQGPVPLQPALCGLTMPDSTIWIGIEGGILVVDRQGRVRDQLTGSRHTALQRPVDMALQNPGSAGALLRVHVLDRESGKVFVYNAKGELTLIYPRDRELEQPTMIAFNRGRRQIYIGEASSSQITVFGY